jgi:hypothetical protein
MAVSITPEKFTLVQFDRDELHRVLEQLIAAIGLPDDIEIVVNVDETTPLGRASIASYDPVVIAIESGALEDPKKPRQLSPSGSADVLGRLLLRVHDRRDPAFGDPPSDDELPLRQSVAWDVYSIGRLVRLGYRHYDNRQRRLYHFRNRHGFTDAADEAFDRLWTSDGLSWSDLASLSDNAAAVAGV